MDSEYRGDDEIDAVVDPQPSQPTPDEYIGGLRAHRIDPYIRRGRICLSKNCEVDIAVGGHKSVRIEIRDNKGQTIWLDLEPDLATYLADLLSERAPRAICELAAG